MTSLAIALSTAARSPLAGVDAELSVLDDPVEQQAFTRWRTAADGRREAESAFQISGMHCAACAELIETALRRQPGVVDAQVNASAARAQVTWRPEEVSASVLVRAIQQAGYGAVPDAAAPAREQRRLERRRALWRLFVASFCAMQVMMFATPSYVTAAGEMAPDLRQLLNWGSWLVSLPVLIFSAGPFFSGAWRSLRQRRIGMDVPVAVGVGVTFLASSGATFDPAGPFGHEVFFDSFTMFISFLLLGRFFEMTMRHRAAETLEQALARMPETAERLDAGDQAETVSVQRLRVGDRVRVAVGAACPADGRLLVGASSVDESVLTGESRPVPKQIGDELVGGSVNLGAPLVMAVERVGSDTRYQTIVAMMRDALSQRPALARSADRFAGPFLWAVLALAALGALVWSQIDPDRAVWVAVSVLIVTCPCALSLAAPSALVAATAALGRRGIVLQRLDALEALAKMQRLFLDKTGTLTEAQARVVATRVLADEPAGSGGEAEDWPTRAASLAAWSQHPLSRALQVHGGGAAEPWVDVQEHAGAGVQGRDAQGRIWRLGAWAWIQGAVDGSGPVRPEPASAGPVVYLGCDGQPLVGFEVDEVVREGAAAALAALERSGVKVALLSGDAPARVEALAARLGLDVAAAGASPETKLAVLGAAQARGDVVGMVGDGVNDAPVLARADVSLAMGQGALVSRLHADAVIVSSRLKDLADARALALRTMAVVRQNLMWAAVYNAACIPLALAGYLPPWAAGLGMASSSLLVVLNAMRLAR